MLDIQKEFIHHPTPPPRPRRQPPHQALMVRAAAGPRGPGGPRPHPGGDRRPAGPNGPRTQFLLSRLGMFYLHWCKQKCAIRYAPPLWEENVHESTYTSLAGLVLMNYHMSAIL